MTVAVVFGLAVADGLQPVVGAAPFDVLSRQLPRLVVAMLNGSDDRGVRFLPFLGNESGKRSFLRLHQPLPPETLATLHRQGDVRCLVDGQLLQNGLRLRIHDAATLRPRFDAELPFDPRQPLDVLPRIQFELMSALGWEGRPAPCTALHGAAQAWYLIAKDELLALEANLLLDPAADPLRAARECVARAAADPDVRGVVIELSVQMLRHGMRRDGVAAMVEQLAARVVGDLALEQRLAELLQACGEDQKAATLFARIALAEPANSNVVEKAAALLFRGDRLREARAVLQTARIAGTASTAALAQLAAIHDRLGEFAERDELCADLRDRRPLSEPVARLLISFLLDAGRTVDALHIAEQALREGDSAALHIERGRALLLLDRQQDATAALQRALQSEPGADQRRECERMLRLCSEPGLLLSLQRIEVELRHGNTRQALQLARRQVRDATDAAEAWLVLGMVRQKLRQVRRAERALRRALSLQPDLAEAHNRLGILLVSRGACVEGHEHLVRAHELSPHDASTRLHLAQACVLLGRRAEGEDHLQAAERLGASPTTLAAVRREFFAAGS